MKKGISVIGISISNSDGGGSQPAHQMAVRWTLPERAICNLVMHLLLFLKQFVSMVAGDEGFLTK